MFMRNKHWSKFHQYAVRVHFLHGPCRSIPPPVQRIVVTCLAQFAGSSLPLLPNLTGLVWGESDIYSIINTTVPLIKYFAGPRVTTVSLFLVAWPMTVSAQDALANLPNLCPNVTSFTAMFRPTFMDYSAEIGNIVRRWPNLRVLRSSALSQPIMNDLASRKTLNTLCANVNSLPTNVYLGQLPTMIQSFSLEGSNALHCIRYLQTLQGTPIHLRLLVGLDITLPSEMYSLFQILPTRFDTTQLRSLAILFKSSFHSLLPLAFPLSEHLLESLYPFSALVTLDLNAFCTSVLDDAMYERMAVAWPELKSLKIGAADESRGEPVASVGAVIAVLRSCPCLETLHVVFNGSIPPPRPVMRPHVDRGTPHGNSVEVGKEGEEERVEDGREATSPARTWGVSNQHITEIHVGHSLIVADRERLRDLVSCLRSVMPRLERIQSRKEPSGVADSWRTAQRLLLEDDVTCP